MTRNQTSHLETHHQKGALETAFAGSLELSIADETHTEAIDSLRQATYARAGYFSLPDLDTVRCRTDSPHAIRLVVTRDATLAATVRLTYARDRKAAEHVLEGEADLPAEFFPAITLCRGATDPQFRGLGLMSFLVSLGVAVAHQAGLGSTLGVQYNGTPHFRAMSRAGWQGRSIEGNRMSTVKGNAPLSLVYIGRRSFADSARQSRTANKRLYELLRADRLIRLAVLELNKHTS